MWGLQLGSGQSVGKTLGGFDLTIAAGDDLTAEEMQELTKWALKTRRMRFARWTA